MITVIIDPKNKEEVLNSLYSIRRSLLDLHGGTDKDYEHDILTLTDFITQIKK